MSLTVKIQPHFLSFGSQFRVKMEKQKYMQIIFSKRTRPDILVLKAHWGACLMNFLVFSSLFLNLSCYERVQRPGSWL